MHCFLFGSFGEHERSEFHKKKITFSRKPNAKNKTENSINFFAKIEEEEEKIPNRGCIQTVKWDFFPCVSAVQS